jgi:hypothetical protein
MNPSAWRVHKFWFVRATLVLVVTGLAEVAVVWLVNQPVRWVVLIAGSLPLSMVFFVALPLLRQEGRKAT